MPRIVAKAKNNRKKEEIVTGFLGGLNVFQDQTLIRDSELTEAKTSFYPLMVSNQDLELSTIKQEQVLGSQEVSDTTNLTGLASLCVLTKQAGKSNTTMAQSQQNYQEKHTTQPQLSTSY